MEHEQIASCPMCGSLMGAEARPAAMRKAAEVLDQIDGLERRLREAERGTWTVTAAAVCGPCQHVLVASSAGARPDVARGLRARIEQLRHDAESRRTA